MRISKPGVEWFLLAIEPVWDGLPTSLEPAIRVYPLRTPFFMEQPRTSASVNVPVVKFYDVYFLKYIHWKRTCKAYKYISDYNNGISFALNHDFCFFAHGNITKFYRTIHFGLHNLIN